MRRTALMAAGVLVTAAAVGCSQSASPVRPSAGPGSSPPAETATSASPQVTPTPVAARVVGSPVLDVTFVSAAHGWALTSGALYETTDRGGRWQRKRLPSSSVTHVRFVTASVGYVWDGNGRLWLTGDDTSSWQRGGLSLVDSLEASGSSVWALAGSLPGAHVWHAGIASTSWTDVDMAPNRTAELFPHGDFTYVLGEEGAGPIAPSYVVYVAGRMSGYHSLPCERPQRLVPQSPMTASTDGSLFLVCDVEPTNARGQQLAYISADHGTTWTSVPAPPVPVDGVAAVRGGRFGWGRDLWAYRAGRWRLSLRGPTGPSGFDLTGFSLVGFQDDTHGVALTNAGQLYLTRDAGRTWQIIPLPSRVPAADCHASGLRVHGGRQGGGFGGAHADLEIANVGSHTCALPSPTGLTVVDASGRRLPIEVLSLDAAAGASAVSLPPRGQAALPLWWQNWCGPRSGPLSISVTLGSGGAVTGSFDGPPDYNYWPNCITDSKRSMLQVIGPYTLG